MPPSAEGLSKPPANRAERRAQKKRRPGKQPGDEGHHLAQVPDPDEVISHRPTRRGACEAELTEAEVVSVETPPSLRGASDLGPLSPSTSW